MALIGKIRDKLGLSVGLIAVGLGLFVLGGDVLGPNSVVLGKNNDSVGKIAGEEVSRQVYQGQIDQLKISYGGNVSNEVLQNQAWEILIERVAYNKEYEALGIALTNEERIDMVQGNNIHPLVLQYFNYPAFRDSITGQLDVNQVVLYMQQISQNEQLRATWENFEDNFLVPTRLKEKYANLISLSTYATTEEAKNEYMAQNASVEASYIYIPFSKVDDSLVTVTDQMLRKYLKENQKRYTVDESKNISFVTFPIIPSSEDSAAYKEELLRLKSEFLDTQDDSVYASIHSDILNSFGTFSINQLPSGLKDYQGALNKGEVIGPLLNGNTYSLYKISDVMADTTEYVRASHILFKAEKDNASARSEARAQAQQVLQEIKGGADFAEMARTHGSDGTASKGGDLGWFTRGRMVAPFEKACFNARQAGLINNLVETDFGYHIINVTQPKNSSSYKIASIEIGIDAGEEANNDIYMAADYFASQCSDLQTFEAQAEIDSIMVYTASNIDKNSTSAGSLANARAIVQWLYADASNGEVSRVFQLEDAFVIAVMTGETKEGTARLEDVRDDISKKVKNDLLKDVIMKRLQSISAKSLEEMAEQYGSEAEVLSGEIKFNTNFLQGVGNAPEAVGRAFSLGENEISKPFATDQGVIVMQVTAKNDAVEIADFANYSKELTDKKKTQVVFNMSEAIKEKADIQDKRYKFY